MCDHILKCISNNRTFHIVFGYWVIIERVFKTCKTLKFPLEEMFSITKNS